MPGGSVVNLGGGGDEPSANPAGGGDSIRILNSCNDSTCQFVEARASSAHACPFHACKDQMQCQLWQHAVGPCHGRRLLRSPLPPLSVRGVAVAQTRDASQRLLAYRWYPTTLSNWDGRLIVASGKDLDLDTRGCAHPCC